MRFNWPYLRRSKADEPDNMPYEDAPALTNAAHRGDRYHLAWHQEQMPSPGAEAFSWRTFGLVPFSTMAIGTGTEPRKHFKATSPGLLQRQTITLQGIPTQQGALRTQPLYDAETGTYTGGVTAGEPVNEPFHRNFSGGQLSVGLY